jgi:competence protein ComEC
MGEILLVRQESSPWSLRALCYRGRRDCAPILSYGSGPRALTPRLIKALLLGYREDISYEMREIFPMTGTFHIFAISGLHVGIVTLLLTGLLFQTPAEIFNYANAFLVKHK